MQYILVLIINHSIALTCHVGAYVTTLNMGESLDSEISSIILLQSERSDINADITMQIQLNII